MVSKNELASEKKWRDLEALEQGDADRWEEHEEAEYDGPGEPDYEGIMQDRWESRFDPDAAQDRYDNSVYDPPGLD